MSALRLEGMGGLAYYAPVIVLLGGIHNGGLYTTITLLWAVLTLTFLLDVRVTQLLTALLSCLPDQEHQLEG